MLDAHPEVRCGQETRVVPRILQFFANWLKSEKETERLEEAGVSKDVLESAVADFCLEVIANHGYAAPRLCNKDPLTLKYGMILKDIFPNVRTFCASDKTFQTIQLFQSPIKIYF